MLKKITSLVHINIARVASDLFDDVSANLVNFENTVRGSNSKEIFFYVSLRMKV